MLDTSRMTDRTRKTLRIAEEQARLRGVSEVLPEHVLLGLIMENVGIAGHVLQNLGATESAIVGSLPPLDLNATDTTEPLGWDDSVLVAIQRANEEAVILSHHYIGTEHLVLGIVLSSEGAVPAILARLNISPDSVKKEVYAILGYEDLLTP